MHIKIIILTLLLLQTVTASYIAGDIILSSDGIANFDIKTDVELKIEGLTFSENQLYGTTEEVMNKKSGEWTFSLDGNSYDTILLDIYLPEETTSINSLNGIKNVLNIEEKIVSLIDEDVSLQFQVSYITKKKKSFTWLWMSGTIFMILILSFFFSKKKKKHEQLYHILPVMNEQEQRILKELMKRSIRQKELRNKLELPKASFSRYMIHLEQKGLILRVGEGRNKMVKLKE